MNTYLSKIDDAKILTINSGTKKKRHILAFFEQKA